MGGPKVGRCVCMWGSGGVGRLGRGGGGRIHPHLDLTHSDLTSHHHVHVFAVEAMVYDGRLDLK